MKLEAVELRRVELPLVSPFRTSFGTTNEREALLVHLLTPEAEGWGECVALSEPVFSSEYVDGVERVIRDHLLPRLFSLDGVTAEAVAPALAMVRGHPMAKAALEMAILDAELRAEGVSLAMRLGAVREEVECGVSVGIVDTIPELLDAVGRYLDEGYRRIKLKIEPGWDLEPVGAVRERFGDIPLQVDANAAYELADA
ncbi:MAG: enolase C-terminal domain-like protein, partial [Actinomycetota bacterium]